MFGRVVLRVEPRLDGLKVVGAKPRHSEWIGRTIPWSRTQLQSSRVRVVDDLGQPARVGGSHSPPLSLWLARDSMSPLAARAAKRALSREIADERLDRAFEYSRHPSEKIGLVISSSLTLFAMVAAVLPFFGRSIMFNVGASPSALDLALVVTVWLLYASLPGFLTFMLWPIARSTLHRVHLGAAEIRVTDRAGLTTVIPMADVAAASSRLSGWQIATRDSRKVFLPNVPGLSFVLQAIAVRLDPSLPDKERRSLRRTLARAAVLWILGSIAAGILAHFNGGPPQTLFANPLHNTTLYIALTAAVPITYLIVGLPLLERSVRSLVQFFERRTRARARRRPHSRPAPL